MVLYCNLKGDGLKIATRNKNIEIGVLNKRVIELLGLEYKDNKKILIGDGNIEHIKRQHIDDYIKYGNDIEEIIKNPTYVARNRNLKSIEYIKEYKNNNDFVLVAVRTTNKGTLFVKTLFRMSERKKEIYLKKGYVKEY